MKTILLIDDDDAVVSTLSLALARHGYRVITANAGEQGLSQARAHFPDLILCDVDMPGTDGRSVLQALRDDPELAGKQVVLITGNLLGLTTRAGMELGADDFLVKPFGVDALIRCVEARLKRADLHWRVEDKLIKDLRAGLHSTLPHEFFTPLAGILGLAEVLRGDIMQLKPIEVQEILDDIERSGRRLHRTLKNYLLILDLESVATAHPFPVFELPASSAREFLQSAVCGATKRHARCGDLVITIESRSIIRVPPDLPTMAEELVENACSYSRKGSPITINLSESGMTVTDNGRGITPAEIQQIGAFRQFDRKKYEQQGLGLGLVVVQKLAVRCDVHFALQSVPGSYTRATLTFNR